MGQVLYRKYRSKSLDEIVGQEHITTTLKNALKTGSISHAYLFTGPRGVGKTSIARILAHELNAIPYTGEDMHLDIIEIDAASNRGIDEIRDLREKVNVAPTLGKYKVYIIDEVHMLTTPAFNALLKTLEEPPAHVVFILATTEAHKLPETIISRTQRYTFRPVERAKVVEHLAHIAKQEKLTVDDEALELIAEHGEGSFRDSISLLNQAAGHSSKVTAKTVQDLLGLPPAQTVESLFAKVEAGDKQTLVAQLAQLYEQGYQAAAVAKQLGQLARDGVLEKRSSVLAAPVLLDLLAALVDVPASPAPERLLEINLLRTASSASYNPGAHNAAPPVSKEAPISKATSKPKATSLHPQPTIAAKPSTVANKKKATQPEVVPKKVTPAPPLSGTLDLEAMWPELLKAIKSQYNTVYGILRMATPALQDGTLTLTFKYSFHQKRLSEAKHRKIIGDAILQLTGQTIAIDCQYDKNAQTPTPQIVEVPSAGDEVATALVATAEDPSIASISNIFGGGELLES